MIDPSYYNSQRELALAIEKRAMNALKLLRKTNKIKAKARLRLYDDQQDIVEMIDMLMGLCSLISEHTE